jgi:chromosome segregation protein
LFLRSLTLRGFKSFAERTTLDLEPGITVIVGPNGSGKSNVVDALAWVLGTRSAKLLRGGELADVIFAGSPAHPPLGRAKVEITIDNSSGQLGDGALGTGGSAQGFSEVTISREITATGESVYAMNGAECRLLDIQELLSDTGLGRELHTIVGQGQLDEILHARPEDRRAFVEEAAGILKHRRRRERAQRKLEQVDVHVEQLRTILRELRRQMRPLERQAEAANRHAALQAELREVRIGLAAHDRGRLTAALATIDAGDADVSDRQHDLEGRVGAGRADVECLEERLRRSTPQVDAARDALAELHRIRERVRGTADLVAARRRHLLEYVEEPLAGRPPAELREQADRLEALRDERAEELATARASLEAATVARGEAERARRQHDDRVAEAARARSEARERLARWEGERDARRRASAAVERDIARTTERLAVVTAREEELRAELDGVRTEISELDSAEWQLSERLEHAEDVVARARADLLAAEESQRDIERRRDAELARAEALRQAGSPEGGPILTELDGCFGPLAEHVRIESGAEAAVAAALGPLEDALIAASVEDAGRAIADLRREGEGRAVVLPADGPTPGERPLAGLPDGVRALSSCVTGRGGEHVVGAVERVLADTYLVPEWSLALDLHRRHPSTTFVTREGDLVGPRGLIGGRAPEGSVVLASAAAAQAERRAAGLRDDLDGARIETERARARLHAGERELAAATDAINASDARITGAAEELARLNKELAATTHALATLAAQRAELVTAQQGHREALEELETSVPPVPDEVSEPVDLDRLDDAVATARRRELDARLTVERLDERVHHHAEAAEALRREAEEVGVALEEAARRRELRREHIRRCGELDAFCAEVLAALATAVDDAGAERDRLVAERQAIEEDLDTARGALRTATEALDDVRERRHATELRRADVRHELTDLEARLRDRFGLTLDDLAEESPATDGTQRSDLVEREDTLVRQLGLLGRINPLALEEFEALEERHAFLSAQIEDLRSSQRDLERVITAVDAKIEEVFAEAFADVAREFSDVFDRVFPGGDGRLILTDPDDLLTTGIEVEARPPGKRIKRLSLLSGGERSLTALAFLFAIFRARPSPFYVLDEVEAALDDVNLHRLLGVIEEFKEHAQLLVVTHQKRTMEVADVLYGVSMGEDAVSKVVSERLAAAV